MMSEIRVCEKCAPICGHPEYRRNEYRRKGRGVLEKKSKYWRRLDNAAKLFTAASTKNDTRVFRFYCELKEEIRPDLLQEATEMTVETYPLFLSVMRKGVFWNYLERSNLKPVVREEYKEPCSRLYFKDSKTLLFEVTYYKRRINFETFHVLTDGTGATAFLCELVSNYLYLAHKEEGLEEVHLVPEGETIQDHETDSFKKYYSPELRKNKSLKPRAYILSKQRKESGQLQVGQREISVKSIVTRARELGVSVTVLITAVYLMAIHEEMPKAQEKYPVGLMVPVNLRNFFPSASMLNFFSWISPQHRFGAGSDSFEEVLAEVKNYFKEELTKEKMAKRMSELISLEVHPILRFVPSDLKNLCIHAGAKVSERSTTAIFSNMGIFSVPKPYADYIERVGCYTSTPKMELCTVSFGDRMLLAFTSRFDTDNIQRNFYRILEEQGVESRGVENDFPEPKVPSDLEVKIYKNYTILCLALIMTALIIGWNAETAPLGRAMRFTAGGILSMWTASSIGYYKRRDLLKNAQWQLILVSVACVIWDVLTGWHGWSLDFVIPAVTVGILVVLVILVRIQRHLPKDYMFYFVLTAGYGILLPMGLWIAGMLKVVLPSMICSATCLLFFVWLLSFRGREFREEMQKKFHV